MTPEAVTLAAQNEYAGSLLGQIERWIAAQQPHAFRSFGVIRDVESGVYAACLEADHESGPIRGLAQDRDMQEAIRRALKDATHQGELMDRQERDSLQSLERL